MPLRLISQSSESLAWATELEECIDDVFYPSQFDSEYFDACDSMFLVQSSTARIWLEDKTMESPVELTVSAICLSDM